MPVIEAIVDADPSAWDIDAHAYTEDNIEALRRLASTIRAALPGRASDTLVTKVMLGVFGNVPAYDTYFKRAIGVWAFGAKSLRKIGNFYQANAEVIEDHRIRTLDFSSGGETSRRYSRAKVIDMAFFIEGGAGT